MKNLKDFSDEIVVFTPDVCYDLVSYSDYTFRLSLTVNFLLRVFLYFFLYFKYCQTVCIYGVHWIHGNHRTFIAHYERNTCLIGFL